MHPAKSVIFFTTASGAGYGLFAIVTICDLFALLSHAPLIPHGSVATVTIWLLGLGLITAGLLSSTFHLGHPERAWRALSQWRSSWLSREGVFAIWTFFPILLLGVVRFFGLLDPESPFFLFLLLLTLVSCLGTLYCTAMIYASLRPVPSWSTFWTPVNYLVLGPMTGAVLLSAISHILGFPDAAIDVMAMLLLAAGLIVKALYWRHQDKSAPVSTIGTATGLGRRVEMLSSPHSGTNYLMREMGFQLARKHSAQLRLCCLITAFGLPVLSLMVGLMGAFPTFFSLLAAACLAVGIVAERYLFFAEAWHVQSLYYGHEA